jgi:hypothetical protein
VARFENGVFPFRGTLCGAPNDYFFAQYNLPGDGGVRCPGAPKRKHRAAAHRKAAGRKHRS